LPAVATLPAYEGLLYTVFQQLRQADSQSRGLAIAFTSANSGEGVTHTIQALLSGLSRDGASRTLVADSRYLRQVTVAPLDLPMLFSPIASPSSGALFALSDPADFDAEGPHSWEGSWEYRRDIVEALRAEFDYVLIDCPALRESNDILSLAPFVSGVILIVEADKTRRDQILNAEKSIEFARGKLIGHILNKRSYLVPEWIYRRL
jgi:Mrp family chromosome partitioning ATPase